MVNLWSQDRAIVMGIINITPDSFSDGGLAFDPEAAVARARQLAAEGADILDIGAESARPGATPISVDAELQRLLPVLERLQQEIDLPISVDTYKPQVMQAAVAAGAAMINDIKALQEPGALAVASQLSVPICLMHMQNQPENMQQAPHYTEVVTEVADFFAARIAACSAAGIATERLILDPGFGFGKNLSHNIDLFRGMPSLCALGQPLLIGVSRKTMVGQILNAAADAGLQTRLQGSVALAVLAYARGARIFRVHDVAPTVDALKMAVAIETGIAA